MKKDLVPAVAYCRVSTLSEDQENSFENQQSFFNRECERLGYYLVEDVGIDGIFADHGISAKSMIKRPEFLKMKDKAKTKQFQRVLVTNISRFCRNVSDATDTIRELKKNGVYVHFIKENLQTSDSNDEFIIGILNQLAQQDIVEMSKKIQFGMREVQKKGKWTSQPPYGYDRINGYLQINEEEGQVVELMFYFYVYRGFSIDKIVRELNSIGILTKKGKKWQHTTIRHIIENPIYIGLQINHQYEMKDIFINLVEKINEHEQIKNHFEHLRIIENEAFFKAQEIKKERSQMVDNKKKYSSKNVLSNIFFCGNCGASMKRMQRSDKKGQFYYVCSNCHKDRAICSYYNYIKEEDVFNYITIKIKEFVKNPKEKRRLKNLYQFYIDKYMGKKFRNQLPEIEFQIERLENRKKNYQEMRADGDLSKEDFRNRMDELEKDLNELYRNKDKILNIEREISKIWDIFDKLIENADNFNITQSNNNEIKKLIIRLTHITIDGEKILNIQLNNGLDIDLLTLEKEYASQIVDF